MKNTALYVLTVLIWGSTWLAIEFQVGEVSIIVSVMYRFIIAAALMWAICFFKRLPMRCSWRNHVFFILLALGCFSFNYIFMYWAQAYLSSAMASIAFSTLLLMNICNTRLFFGKHIARRVYLGAAMGIGGITALFWHDLHSSLGTEVLFGLALALSGTLIASFGNMVSVRNSSRGIGIIQGNAWGTLYGAIILIISALVSGQELTLPHDPDYYFALAYLSVFGTVIAFASYFALLKNIGPEKASYAIILFPLVAVLLGSFYDGFNWYTSTIIGFALVLLGNLVVLAPKKLSYG